MGVYTLRPFLPTFLGTPLHIFAFSRNATLLFSIDCALFAQFCRHAELNSFLFNQFRTLLQKHPGGGHVLKENRLAVVALRDAADVFAGIHQPLIVGTVSFFQGRNFFLKLQARCSSRQGCDAGSCCEPGARLPRNQAAPFLAPSPHPQVRQERPRQISLVIPDRSLQRSCSKSRDRGCRESLPAFSRPRRRFQEPCCCRQACLAAVRERRGHAKLAALQSRRESLRHAQPAPAPAGNVVLPAGRAWAIPLPLYFDAVLGRWMAEAVVYARQRTFADFLQHAEMNGSLFVRGRVRNWVRVAARQPVYRALDRIHGHVEFFALHSVGNQSAHAKLSVA